MPRTIHANNKTQPHNGDVVAFLNGIEHVGRLNNVDVKVLVRLVKASVRDMRRRYKC